MGDDFNAFGASENAFRDSGFNARGRREAALVIARDIFFGARVVWDACPGYPYLTRFPGNNAATIPCGTVVSAVGFETNIFPAPGLAWSIASGALPAGIALDNPVSTQIDLVGATSDVGDFPFRVHAENDEWDFDGDFVLRVSRALLIEEFADITSALGGGYTWDGTMLPCSSPEGGSTFGVSGVGYVSRACGGASGPYVFALVGPTDTGHGIAMVVYSSSATGFEAYYEKFGPDFSYPGVYTKNIGSGPGPATITLSEI